jgi:hypothetical protein
MSQPNEPHELLPDDITLPPEQLEVLPDPIRATTTTPTTVPPNIGTN